MNKYYTLLIFLVVMASCRKKQDEAYPAVSFQSPATNTSFNVLEPVNFKVIASDETDLQRITVSLLNGAYLSVAPSVTLTCDANEEAYEHYIIPSDIHIPSGTYYLKAVAYDGFNEKVAYREIILNEVPKVLTNVFVGSQPTGNTINIDSIAGTVLQNCFSLNSDLTEVMVNSYYQFMTIAGSQTGDLKGIDMGNFNTIWTIVNPGTSSTAYFCSSYNYGDKVFVGDKSGKIKSYRRSNQPLDVIDLGNQYAEEMVMDDQFLVCSAVANSGGQRSIRMYYLQSGIFYQSLNVNFEIVKMFRIGSDEILLFCNEAGQGKIKTYTISTLTIFEPLVFSGGVIYDAVQLDSDTYLIAHSTGIHQYINYIMEQNALISGSAYQQIEYEELSNSIYAAKMNNLEIYDLPTLNSLGNFVATDSIAGIQLLYNK